GPSCGPAAGGLPFFLYDPGESAEPLAKRMVAVYDRDSDGKLSRAEVGLDKATFAALDADGDGLLDAAELARWVERPPALALVVSLERGSRRPVTVLGGALRAKASMTWNRALLVAV